MGSAIGSDNLCYSLLRHRGGKRYSATARLRPGNRSPQGMDRPGEDDCTSDLGKVVHYQACAARRQAFDTNLLEPPKRDELSDEFGSGSSFKPPPNIAVRVGLCHPCTMIPEGEFSISREIVLETKHIQNGGIVEPTRRPGSGACRSPRATMSNDRRDHRATRLAPVYMNAGSKQGEIGAIWWRAGDCRRCKPARARGVMAAVARISARGG